MELTLLQVGIQVHTPGSWEEQPVSGGWLKKRPVNLALRESCSESKEGEAATALGQAPVREGAGPGESYQVAVLAVSVLGVLLQIGCPGQVVGTQVTRKEGVAQSQDPKQLLSPQVTPWLLVGIGDRGCLSVPGCLSACDSCCVQKGISRAQCECACACACWGMPDQWQLQAP